MTFATDIDLLLWEPKLLEEAAFASQILLSGSCDLNATAITIASGSFIDSKVQAGNVVVLAGSIAGCFPIVTVDSATELNISALYADLSEPLVEPSVIGTAAGLTFSIRTFWAQRQIVSDLILATAGLNPDVTGDQILLTPSLRRACALGSLQMIYNAIAATADETHHHAIRASVYGKLYRRALRLVRLEIDTNGDGEAEIHRDLNISSLIRR